MSTDLLIVGSGALATLFAARLSEAGLRVTMLGAWQAGLEALPVSGARLNGGKGMPVLATNDPDDCRGAKYALVLVKSWQTEETARRLSDCLAMDGLAVTLQNGLGNDTILIKWLGQERVTRGVTTLGATLVAPGSVRSAGAGTLTLEAGPRLAELKGMLQLAKFDPGMVEDIQPAVWSKLIINSAINPMTALLQLKNGKLLQNPPAHALMGDLAGEFARVASVLGIDLPFSDPVSIVEDVAQRTAENTSSMLQDILRGAPTEVDAINGEIIRLGEKQEVPTPVNRLIYSLVKALVVRGRI